MMLRPFYHFCSWDVDIFLFVAPVRKKNVIQMTYTISIQYIYKDLLTIEVHQWITLTTLTIHSANQNISPQYRDTQQQQSPRSIYIDILEKEVEAIVVFLRRFLIGTHDKEKLQKNKTTNNTLKESNN